MSDALGVGASVLAFVLLGLKTAKVIHDTLSSFKNGSDGVTKATADVKSLVSALEQLEQCRILEKYNSKALTDDVKACLDDLESFADKLKPLSTGVPGSRRDKYRKRFLAMWDEKALSTMSAKLASHTANLTLRLNILQSNTIIGIPDQLASMGQDLVAQRTAQEAQLGGIREQAEALGVVNEGLAHLRNGIGDIRGEMQLVSSTAATNHVETRSLLEQILQQVTKLSLTDQRPTRVTEIQDTTASSSQVPDEEATKATESNPCEKLVHVITRLCKLVDDRQLGGRLMPEEAQDIISDILVALELMKSKQFLQARVESGLVDNGYCQTCCRSHVADLHTSLTTVYAALTSSKTVSVNEVDRVQRSEYSQVRWALSSYNVGIGAISVLSRRRSNQTQQSEDSGQPDTPDLSQEAEEEVTTSVSLVVRSARSAIKLKTRQTHSYDGVFTTIPRLFVNNVLPADSPVFSIVRNGLLREFQALLSEGKASLRDQDEYGAPLLFYANINPDICRYLIQSGVDVDHVAGFDGVGGEFGEDFIGSALYLSLADCDMDESELEPVLLCRKYLLEAGCDPTIPFSEGGTPCPGHLEDVFNEGVPDAIRLTLDFCGIVDAPNMNIGGSSPLLLTCSLGRWSVESLAILLQRKADATARDTDGGTCLHNCLSPKQVWPWREAISTITQLSAALVMLINHGADVYAENNYGESVSDFAYADFEDFWGIGRGISVRGDVWDFALAVCGYRISEFRKGAPRKAGYGEFYNRQAFEELWRGYEHLCPYFDIEEDPTSNTDQISSEDGDDDEEDEDVDDWSTTDSED